MSRIIWTPEKRFLSELIPYDRNPRKIVEAGIKRMEESFDEIGMAQLININTKNVILSGHARYLALAREAGWKIEKAIDENTGQDTLKVFEQGEDIEVDVFVPDRELTPKQEEAVLIRMNATQGGDWDLEKLKNGFKMDDLKEWGIDEKLFPKQLEPQDYGGKNKEIDTEDFGDDLEHTCPKCGFEFN